MTDEDATPATNRLVGETSPYLLQHAHNPVDWYPWGEDALERARREDKPILLSIGYAACHWCHVMERESFEDPGTAALMNEHFVSIKVDREERPDLDAIYMDAVQAMTGSGGWPMTVFLEPDGTPFFAGTYFPKEDRFGMPAFSRVLLGVAEAWKTDRASTAEQGERVRRVISRAAELPPSDGALDESLLRDAFEGLKKAFDPEWGGFGGAPKFPQPMTLEFVLRCREREWDGAEEMLAVTLDRMARGGVYDQVGGGFHRYSVDDRWHVPHFEKMLYDNAQLLRVYAAASRETNDLSWVTVSQETEQYLRGDLRHAAGGFFSSQDADSEGVEGKFYVWSWDELVDVVRDLTPHVGRTTSPELSRRYGSDAVAAIQADVVATAFGAIPDGNWEGTNVLWKPRTLGEVALDAGIDAEDLRFRLMDARSGLRERRGTRVAPETDDKVLAGWNGLVIAALADAELALRTGESVAAARQGADFVLTQMRRDDGRLLRSWRDGQSGRPGYLDDYALMADGCLALYEATFDARWFREARSLADDLLRLFLDEERGGFFQTGSDAEPLLVRPKDLYDNAVPSGNSAAALVLLKLSRFTGEAAYEDAALSALRLVSDGLRRAPTGFGHALCALDFAVGPVREIAIVGDPDGEDTRGLLRVVRERLRQNVVVAVASPRDRAAADVIPLLRDRPQVDERATAYVCERFACKLPVTEPEHLARLLDAKSEAT